MVEGDVRQEILLIFCPVVATALSFAVLSASALSVRTSKREALGDRRSWITQTSSQVGGAVEPAAILAGLALVLSSCEFGQDGHVNYSAYVGVLSWIYLLLLFAIRQTPLKAHAWYHSACLYGLHWVITSVLLFGIALRSGFPSTKSPLLQGFIVISVLLYRAIQTPITVIGVQKNGESNAASRKRTTTALGVATFSWLDPLLWLGYRRRLEVADLWELVDEDKSSRIHQSFNARSPVRGLLWQLLHYLGPDIFVQAIWAVLSSIFSFAPTLLLQSILQHIESPTKATESNVAWQYLALMLITGCMHALADGQTAWTGQRIALKLRAVVVGEIYKKAIRREATSNPPSAATNDQGHADNGTITNLISSDSEQIADAGANAYEVWVSVPVRVAIALGLLFRLLGISSLAGVVMMLCVAPINSVIAKHLGKAAMDAAGATDARVQETNQLLRNIRMIKLFVWEDLFEQRVLEKRFNELRALRLRLMWWSVFATIWYIVPFVIAFLSFFVFTAVMGGQLTTSVAFTALSLFNLLKAPLDQLVGMMARVQQSLMSIGRVEAFLREEDTAKYELLTPSVHDRSNAKSTPPGLKRATVGWVSTKLIKAGVSKIPGFKLSDISANFVEGELNLITGRTGCGKSSTLMALLGEMTLLGGAIKAPNVAVAYCAQEAWLMNDTVKSNIVFTSPWDPKRYKQVIHACALVQDLAILKAGDSTMVGEKGMMLSGGQKQRLALARALYSDCEYVLLDDCLSAVDSHTAKWLLKKCINGPLMAGRTRILATHNLQSTLAVAAYVVVLDRGRVSAIGTPQDLRSTAALQELLSDQQPEDSTGSNVDSSLGKANGEQPQTEPSPTAQPSPVMEQAAETHTADDDILPDPIVERPAGHIPFSVVTTYLSAMGGFTFWFLITVFFVAQQVVAFGANWWLREFANAYTRLTTELAAQWRPSIVNIQGYVIPDPSEPEAPAPVDTWFYLGVYASVLLLYAIVSFGRLYAASSGSLNASTTLHKKLLATVLRAKFQFFDETSHGALLNRFSRDIQSIDNDVMPMALGTLHFLVMTISTIALIALLTPSFLLPGILMMISYTVIGRLFLDSSRELKRMESQEKDPLYQHVSETLLGVVTIRAFAEERSFMRDNQSRIDAVNRLTFYLGAVDRWLAFRLNVAGTLMSVIAGYFAINNIGSGSAGAIGMSLTYAITFSENILWLVRYHALNQQNFTSVERIKTCFAVDQEAPAKIKRTQPSRNWPEQGAVRFEQYSTRYRPNLPLILKGLAFQVRPRERLAVVGRTGAGKSSLALALLRGLEACEGRIIIDEIDVGKIGLNDVRRAVAFVPQDPSLFTGDLRSNLDPFGQHQDDQILQALQDVGLIDETGSDQSRKGTSRRRANSRDIKDSSASNENSFEDLAMSIHEGGSNVSLGQRQLLCLARALLRRARIIVMDEATASIDNVSDMKIQRTVSTVNATVITVAHRLHSIADYDRVLVLDQGEVRQLGHPWELMRQDGIFKTLCKDSGNIADLEGLAKAAWKTRKQ